MLKFPKTKFQLLLSVLAMLMAQMEDGVEAQNSHGDPCTNQCQKVQHHHHHLHRHRHHSSSSSEDESSLSPISVKRSNGLMSVNIWLRNPNQLSSSFSGKPKELVRRVIINLSSSSSSSHHCHQHYHIHHYHHVDRHFQGNPKNWCGERRRGPDGRVMRCVEGSRFIVINININHQYDIIYQYLSSKWYHITFFKWMMDQISAPLVFTVALSCSE